MASLGLNPALLRALEEAGKGTATAVQAEAVPLALSGKDVVIGAETGGGKTLAYLIPTVQKLLNWKPEPGPSGRPWKKYPDAVVLVPNKDLVRQALRMADELLVPLAAADRGQGDDVEEDGMNVVARGWHGRSIEWPFSPRRQAPEILICTPKLLAEFSSDLDLFANVHTVVVDEADLIFDRGGYEADMEQIRVGFLRAARVMKQHNRKTQYLLSAATIPTVGLKSISEKLKKQFPRAAVVSAAYMHKHHPATEQEFVQVGADFGDKLTATVDALSRHAGECPKSVVFADTAQMAKNVASALEAECDPSIIGKVLGFHKLLPETQRDEALLHFASEPRAVLVCTDLGARGFDFPDVRHVIQFTFATNVVQHLHRVGRATRAGRAAGRATNLYDASIAPLVEAIRGAGDGSLDASFSRRRRFKKRMKKGAKQKAEIGG